MSNVKMPKLAPLPRGQGALRWNKTGTLVELRFRLDGKQQTVVDTTRQGAITKAEQMRRHEITGAGTGTVAALLAEWYAIEVDNYQDNTRDSKERSIAAISEAIGDILVTELRVGDVERMYRTWTATLSHDSIAKQKSPLNSAIVYAMRLERIEKNVVALAVLPGKRGAPKPRPAVWLDAETAEQMQRELIDDGDTVATMSLVMLTMGLRAGEAKGLTWKDVDLDTRRLVVRQALQRTNHGRGRRLTTNLKTTHAARELVVPAVTVAALRRHRVNQSAARLASGPGWSDLGLVFANDRGGWLLDTKVKKSIWRHCDAVGTPRITPTSFRHTFASLCINALMPYPDIAKLMGHTTVRKLIDTYGHPMVSIVDSSSIFDQMAARSSS